MDIDQDAYSVEEFARRHGIGRTTAYEEIKDGRLVARKVGSRTIVTDEDARAWRVNLPKVAACAAA
jgi:excisionase family DNA binding protein